MSVVEKINQETEKLRKELDEKKEFRELEGFYEEMKRLGVARTAKYDLPPADTLGKRFYDIQHAAGKKGFV